MEVPRTPTPLEPAETAQKFLEAWEEVFGGRPNRSQAEWLLSLLWNENRSGEAIIQHNWGNLSTKNFQAAYWRPPWFRLEDIEAMQEPARSRHLAIHQRMLEGKEPEAFRAFSDHETGARVWLERLRERFPTILEASLENSAVAMQDAIFESGYCASPACRTNAPRYQQLRDEIRALGLFQKLRSAGRSSSGTGLGLLFGAGALFLAWGLAWAARTTR